MSCDARQLCRFVQREPRAVSRNWTIRHRSPRRRRSRHARIRSAAAERLGAFASPGGFVSRRSSGIYVRHLLCDPGRTVGVRRGVLFGGTIKLAAFDLGSYPCCSRPHLALVLILLFRRNLGVRSSEARREHQFSIMLFPQHLSVSLGKSPNETHMSLPGERTVKVFSSELLQFLGKIRVHT